MIDFSRRELGELNSEIYEIGPLFDFAHFVEHLFRNGFYLEAHRTVDQFLQEVGRDDWKYSLLIESLREGINESQRVSEATIQ